MRESERVHGERFGSLPGVGVSGARLFAPRIDHLATAPFEVRRIAGGSSRVSRTADRCDLRIELGGGSASDSALDGHCGVGVRRGAFQEQQPSGEILLEGVAQSQNHRGVVLLEVIQFRDTKLSFWTEDRKLVYS